MPRTLRLRPLLGVVLALAATGCSATHVDRRAPMSRQQVIAYDRAQAPASARKWVSHVDPTAGATKIKHVVMIMQENRSFDSYFGTYPGADGIATRHGKPVACLPLGTGGRCVRPYPDHHDVNGGGPHGVFSWGRDLDGGRMDGFVRTARRALRRCADENDPRCTHGNGVDVMGYHTRSDLPNYWAYAKHFVLQDHLFEPLKAWSLPAHLWTVSGWSARCRTTDPFSCTNFRSMAGRDPADGWVGDGKHPLRRRPIYAWTDLTYLLHQHGVSWGYYVAPGTEPDCRNSEAVSCKPVKQSPKTPGIWNPLPSFVDVRQDHQLHDIAATSSFMRQARTGHLPAVSWVVPSGKTSEHPPHPVSAGQSYVTRLVNTIMSGPQWRSTAIFVSWDDWGGFYDHVRPPTVDRNGYGARVPGLLISPYARRGYVDHQTLSFDAYVKLIEDLFLGGQRLDPATDGRPDPRPDVRENAPQLGNLLKEFDFSQRPRRPLLLPVHPHTSLVG
ncbi:MAG: alkaline phosphatase family protein [Nocardioidaceae bacterium]